MRRATRSRRSPGSTRSSSPRTSRAASTRRRAKRRDVSVRATQTATFAAAKAGHWIAPGKQHTGELRVIDIGIPAGGPVRADVGLLTARVHALVPGRGAPGTKFTSGHVVVAGGSRGLTGAPCLASEAAMRAGAGYVTALVPGSLELVFETRLLEVMTRALPDSDGALTPAGVEDALEACWARGRARAGPRPRPQRRRVRVRTRFGGSRGGGAAARRRRPERPRRGARRARGAPGADGADAPRGRAWAAAGSLERGDRGAAACRARARPHGARARSSCSRATTRSSRRPTGPPRSTA